MTIRFLPLIFLGLCTATASTSVWAGGDDLEKVINGCETTYLSTRQYGQCAMLEHDTGFAYLRANKAGDFKYMLLPLAHITGIEDPALLTSKAPSWFYLAWQARGLLMEHVFNKKTHNRHLPESDISLTINPVNRRSQNHMNIHVSCLQPSVKASLYRLNITPALMNDWAPVTLKTREGDLAYFAHKMTEKAFRTGNLFEMVHTRWGGEMKYATVTVVSPAGGGYLALVRVGSEDTPTGAGELQDDSCSIAVKGPLQDSFPQAKDATGENGTLLTRDNYYNLPYLTVTAPAWDGMAKGQKVSLRWDGPRHRYDTVEKTVTDSETNMSFEISRYEIIDSIGETATLSFQVNDGNGGVEQSGILPLQVEKQPLELPAPVLSSDYTHLEIHYPGMKHDHKIRGRYQIQGFPPENLPEQGASDSGHIRIRMQPGWQQFARGKDVYINYSVTGAGDPRMQFSQLLRVKP